MKERIKTITVFLLFISVIGLSLLNWFYWMDYSLEEAVYIEAEEGILVDIGRPLSGDYERYRTQLVEFLVVADTSAVVSAGAWNRALKNGVHLEYLTPTPLWLITESMSFRISEVFGDISALELILSTDGLYVYDGKIFRVFSAPLSFSISETGTETANDETDSTRPLAALTYRFLEEPHISDILRCFGFNPNTNSRYHTSNGDNVIVDDVRTLQIGLDGHIVYHDSTKKEPVDVKEALKLCLSALPGGSAFWGEGHLVFNSVTEVENGYNIIFSYVLDGGVFIESNTYFSVRDGVISEAIVNLLPAHLSSTTIKLIPEKRALALLPDNKRLGICYRINNEGAWIPDWYSY